jgi:hypothetical protein
MELLISAADVIDIAITAKNFRADYIRDSMIEIAQENYLLPVLGSRTEEAATDNIYNHLMATPYANLTAEYKTLIDEYIKPALAYYVKYLIMPDVYAQMTNVGIQQNNMEYSQTVSNADKNAARAQAKECADVYIQKMIRLLETSTGTSYQLYSSCSNSKNRYVNKGGLIFKKRRG